MSNRENPGLYIHVPFCRTKCPYCDFYSLASSSSLLPAWLGGIRKEMFFYKDRFAAFDSLYLGGGTPSLLDERQLTMLMNEVRRHFAFSSDTEITIEVNPDDVTAEKLALFRDLGFNRISVGAQSFNENELRFLKRRYTARQTHQVLERIRASGFMNLGVDLIYGFQGQSRESWIASLKEALTFRPEHLSCYQMTLAEGTLFGTMKEKGRMQPLGEEEERAFFLLTSQFLEKNGYLHYEISNFAKGEQYASRHNQKYWRHVPYLGLGPAAHSFQGNSRWWNVRSVRKYCRILEEGKTPVEASETLSAEQLRLESLCLGFRTQKGIDLGILSDRPHSNRVLEQLRDAGLVEVRNGRVLPTRQGFLVSDGLPLLF